MITPNSEVLAKWLELSKIYSYEAIRKGTGLTYKTIIKAFEGKPISVKTYSLINNFFISEERKRKGKEAELCGL